jgi:hypothetical protein
VILLSLASAHVYCHFLSAADEVWHGFAYRFDVRLMGGQSGPKGDNFNVQFLSDRRFSAALNV